MKGKSNVFFRQFVNYEIHSFIEQQIVFFTAKVNNHPSLQI